MIQQNRAKTKLVQGGYAFGTWIVDSRHAAIIRQVAEAGFDFVYLEMESSGLSWETIFDFCEMARALGMPAIVRPAELTRASTLRLMEIGAMGVMFHDVDDRAEVEEIRDWIVGSKALMRPDKARQAASDVAVVIQIETVKGLEAVEQIVAGGGIDIVEIGCGDLATQLGFPAQRNHPQVNAAIDRIVKACTRNAVAVGVTCFSPEDVADMVRRGVRCLSYSGDRYILDSVFREAYKTLSRSVPT